jgi:four helix bundle protein
LEEIMAQRFRTLDASVELIRLLRQPVTLIARRDRDLADQLRRAATSVPSNISEGSQRAGKDRNHFYRIAAGSAAEVRTQLEVAEAWGYLDRSSIEPAMGLLAEILAMLWKLTR